MSFYRSIILAAISTMIIGMSAQSFADSPCKPGDKDCKPSSNTQQLLSLN